MNFVNLIMSLFSKKPVEKLSIEPQSEFDSLLYKSKQSDKLQPKEILATESVEKQSGENVICTGPQCRKRLFFLKPPNRPLCNDCIEKLY
jgi:hypothetical protein